MKTYFENQKEPANAGSINCQVRYIPTPRTDENIHHIMIGAPDGCDMVPASVSRKLELELHALHLWQNGLESEIKELRIKAEENARLLEITKRLQKIASAFLGWHSAELPVETFREITAAVLAANDILPNAQAEP